MILSQAVEQYILHKRSLGMGSQLLNSSPPTVCPKQP
jgi:hypothetical protein